MLRYFVVISCVLVGASFAAPNCSLKPKKEDLKECCKKPPPLQEVGAKCAEKYPMNGELNFCHGECMFNATGLLANGQIQSEKAATIIADMLKDFPDYIPVMKAAFPKCDEQAKAHLPKIMEKKPEDAAKCNPLPALIAGCVFVETLINCPASVWQNKDVCNEAKEFFKNCPMMGKD